MSRLFIGQRVRIARIEFGYPRWLIGREGVVCEVRSDFDHPLYGLDIAPTWEDDDFVYGFDRNELEPIQPEGMKPVEWSECLWQPDGVSA